MCKHITEDNFKICRHAYYRLPIKKEFNLKEFFLSYPIKSNIFYGDYILSSYIYYFITIKYFT